jgi:hypothetical protein
VAAALASGTARALPWIADRLDSSCNLVMEVNYEPLCRSRPYWFDDRCDRPDVGVGISVSGSQL